MEGHLSFRISSGSVGVPIKPMLDANPRLCRAHFDYISGEQREADNQLA